MRDALVSDTTPVEFFREQLERAMQHQRVSTSAFTEFYLVNLMAKALHAEALPGAEPGSEEPPLAILWVRALESARAERARLLRALGDNALFVAGFFGDSLNDKLVDFAYYRTMGGRAYECLSREASEARLLPDVFSELSQRFAQFADLLAEVAELSRLDRSNRSVIELYERWQRTGSPRAARLLAERGLAPGTSNNRLQ